MYKERNNLLKEEFYTEFQHDSPHCARRLSPNEWEVGVKFTLFGQKPLPAGIPPLARFTILKTNGTYFVTKAVYKEGHRMTK